MERMVVAGREIERGEGPPREAASSRSQCPRGLTECFHEVTDLGNSVRCIAVWRLALSLLRFFQRA